MYDFKQDLVEGHNYEDKFVDFLLSKGINEQWIRRADKKEKFSDWDIKVEFPITEDQYRYKYKSNSLMYEIKRDRWINTTKNICIETYSRVWDKGATRGWFMKTKATHLVIFDTPKSFVIFEMYDVREHWYNYPQMWKKCEITQDDGSRTINWLSNYCCIKHKRIEL
jgi:hypothetical protein